MPLQARRPNLPALCLPGRPNRSLNLSEEVHTPIPITPMPFEHAPLVMTPDTPAFEMASLQISLIGAKRSFGDDEADVICDDKWTENEDGLLQSYLAHPPRPLRTAYPPGTLPPPAALDEITTQVIAGHTRRSSSSSSESDLDGPISSWRHSWEATRRRLFNIARKESMNAIGGHRREKSESIVPASFMVPAGDAIMKPQRPRLAVLGGASMSRQQHSMDSLYGDEEPHTFEEALRLSSNLQDNADGANSILTSGSGLSSPLAFNFNFASAPARKPFPFSAPSTFIPRPASLLQRGRSFTSEDFAREQAMTMSKSVPNEFVLDADSDDDLPTITVRGEMRRSASSPVSVMQSSPPSSVSSKSADDSELEIELEMESAPITPMEQTFSSALGAGGLLGDHCLTPTPRATPAVPPPAPSITLTVNSPERERPTSTTPRLSSTDSPAGAFSSLCLSGTSLPLALPFTSAPMTTSTSAGVKRALRPPPLGRSLSDSNALSPTFGSDKDRENKRQRALGFAPRFRPGLVVNVPKRASAMLSDELRSPFEFKGGALQLGE